MCIENDEIKQNIIAHKKFSYWGNNVDMLDAQKVL